MAEFYSEIESIADGKIACVCGNSDWRQFVYMAIADQTRAGCKQCARAYIYTDGQWRAGER